MIYESQSTYHSMIFTIHSGKKKGQYFAMTSDVSFCNILAFHLRHGYPRLCISEFRLQRDALSHCVIWNVQSKIPRLWWLSLGSLLRKESTQTKKKAPAATTCHRNRKHDYWCVFILNAKADSTDVTITRIPFFFIEMLLVTVDSCYTAAPGEILISVLLCCFFAVNIHKRKYVNQ